MNTGVKLCLVIGGGNICRGSQLAKLGLERVSADYIGMLSTVINALALQSVIEKYNIDTRVLSAIPMANICEPFVMRKARRHMEKSRIVIFAAGTGNPFVTTDTAAVLRAIEMNCDLLIKGTKVDGIYDKNPEHEDAKKIDFITYDEVIRNNLKFMDMTSISLAKENNLPIKIFSLLNTRLIDVINGTANCSTIGKIKQK